MVITEDSARAFVTSYKKDSDAAYAAATKEAVQACLDKYHKDDLIFIRPSGNPLDNNTMIEMVTSGKAVHKSLTLISIDSVKIIAGGAVSIVTFTEDHVFEYEGTLNEDRAKVSIVLEDVGGQIKMVHGHRCTGQPIPK